MDEDTIYNEPAKCESDSNKEEGIRAIHARAKSRFFYDYFKDISLDYRMRQI